MILRKLKYIKRLLYISVSILTNLSTAAMQCYDSFPSKIIKDDIVSSVIELFKKKEWKTIIETYREHPERNKLLWVFPTEENFTFIEKCLKELKCNKILSIGCGSGLLEWLIIEATGYEVLGIEVDGVWWQSKYAPPMFIPLHFTKPELGQDIMNRLQDSNTALLFCYFNNGPAFKQYLENYLGQTLIIIGPGYGKGVHTDPRPFGDVADDWTLHAWQEVACSRDFIALMGFIPMVPIATKVCRDHRFFSVKPTAHIILVILLFHVLENSSIPNSLWETIPTVMGNHNSRYSIEFTWECAQEVYDLVPPSPIYLRTTRLHEDSITDNP